MAELRRVAALAGVLGQVASAVAGVLPWALLPVALLAFLGGAALAGRADERQAKVLAGIGSAAALVLFLVALPFLSADRDSLRTTLGLLLVGVQVVHSLTWRARRDLETALLVAAALLVLGASFAPDILVGLPLLAGWATVVAGAVLAAGQRAVEGTAGVAEGGRRPPVLAATSLALVLGLAAFLLVPVEPTPQQRNPLAALAAGGGGAARGTVAYSGNRLDMRIRGTLSERPVLEVPGDSPSLWRSNVYPFYDGLGWNAGGGVGRRVPGPPWVVGSTDGRTRTDEVQLRGRPDGTVWTPGEPVQVDAASGPISVDTLGTVRSRNPNDGYRITSRPQEVDPDVLRRATGSERVGNIWLSVPRLLPDRVRALSAQLTADAPTRYDAVVNIESWLRRNFTYTLDSPVPQRGEDAVDRFLFVDKLGFCEQFAAAEVILLRIAGIPARLATGLAAGVDVDGGRRLYREKDLHAWAEVYYPGIGWAPSDPTAGVELATTGGIASIRQRLAGSIDRLLIEAESIPGGRPALAALLLAGAVVAAVGRRLYRPRRRRRELETSPVQQPLRAGPALAAFLRFDERLGERRRRPSESLAELAARLDPEPAAALRVVEDECYAPMPPREAARAAELLDRL